MGIALRSENGYFIGKSDFPDHISPLLTLVQVNFSDFFFPAHIITSSLYLIQCSVAV